MTLYINIYQDAYGQQTPGCEWQTRAEANTAASVRCSGVVHVLLIKVRLRGEL